MLSTLSTLNESVAIMTQQQQIMTQQLAMTSSTLTESMATMTQQQQQLGMTLSTLTESMATMTQQLAVLTSRGDDSQSRTRATRQTAVVH
ncbi:hypothetical protein EON65_59160, partial [archaeon]